MMRQEEVIRFYEGDVKGNDAFWSDAKAYVTWNALLFPGCSTEQARSEENRVLNMAFLDRLDIVEELTCALFATMEKSEAEMHVYRVERYADYKIFQEYGKFVSFISTSTAGFLNAYQDKKDLVLMEITIPKGTYCADFSKLLKQYKKSDEKEILLPPYLCFTSFEKQMDERICKIQDRDGHPPVVYCGIQVKQPSYALQEVEFEKDWIKAGKRCYMAWNQKETPQEKDMAAYCQLKRWLQYRIQKRMQKRGKNEI